MTWSISDEVASLEFDTEERWYRLAKEVIVAVSFNNIDVPGYSYHQYSLRSTGSLQKGIFSRTPGLKSPSWIGNVINSCLVIRDTTEVSADLLHCLEDHMEVWAGSPEPRSRRAQTAAAARTRASLISRAGVGTCWLIAGNRCLWGLHLAWHCLDTSEKVASVLALAAHLRHRPVIAPPSNCELTLWIAVCLTKESYLLLATAS